MEVFLFEPEYYNLRFNCSFYDVDVIPVEQRRHVLLGSVILVCYFVYMVSGLENEVLSLVHFLISAGDDGLLGGVCLWELGLECLSMRLEVI